ncbi:hypothetical protein PF004_g28591 [Phytophthora fragariae]|uniref:Uncharacterized protein n=1 Tax=Phytophthora fragariae TaxID=53985 RepID=A0A6G0QCL2_9STRA|nr:hypothetical protein PF004_g28591 [Phytophthora fragariae]KAE9280047.1 hypothetical protein PF008_g28234 [Phytophthora fragariae]
MADCNHMLAATRCPASPPHSTVLRGRGWAFMPPPTTPDQLYDPVFITKLVLEFQLTFASSLTDFTAKVVPHVAVYMSLVSLGSLLTRSPKLAIAVAITT